MVPRNKTARKNKGVGLTAEEKRAAATQMMAGAQAHQRTSVWCTEKPDAKPPNFDAFLFQSVSLELLLLSIEQSLRLLLLLHYSMIPNNTNHNPRVLYVAMQRKSGGTIGITARYHHDNGRGRPTRLDFRRNHSEKTGCNHRCRTERPAGQAVRGPRGDCGHRVNLHGHAQSTAAEDGSAWVGEM